MLQPDPFIQEVMGERVAEIVGIHSLLDTRFPRKTLQQVPHIDGLDRLGEILFRDPAEDRRISRAVDAELP